MITLQKFAVNDAYRLDRDHSLIIEPDEDFAQVIHRFANLPELRGIFVANADHRLLGVITRTDLLDWARVKLAGFLEISYANLDKTLRLVSLIHASTAGQVMHPDSYRAAVKPDDSLAHAMRQMIELNLIVLPVVDEDKRIIGDLRLSEILARIVEEDGNNEAVKT